MGNKTLNASSGIGSHLKRYLKEQAIPVGVLLCMIVIGSLLTPKFLTPLNLQNLFIQQASNMVAALGMFVAILSGGIDLSIGSVMAVSSVFCASLLMMTNNILAAVLGTLVICAVLGTVNGLIVAKLRVAPYLEVNILT